MSVLFESVEDLCETIISIFLFLTTFLGMILCFVLALLILMFKLIILLFKRTFWFIIIIALIVAFLFCQKHTTYTKTMKLIETSNGTSYLLDEKTNNIFAIDEVLNSIGSNCIVTLDDNNTDWIEDDKITDIKWVK